MDTPHKKQERLKEYLLGLGSVAVAFSSGVDSAFLLKTARDMLGKNAVAVTAKLRSFPKWEFEEAAAFCQSNRPDHRGNGRASCQAPA